MEGLGDDPGDRGSGGFNSEGQSIFDIMAAVGEVGENPTKRLWLAIG